jgi:hypothetical protein
VVKIFFGDLFFTPGKPFTVITMISFIDREKQISRS